MECDILGAVQLYYAARIISHTSPWWAAGRRFLDYVIGEDVIDFYVKLKEDEHMLSPQLKKLLNDLRAGESNIRIDREKIQAELETLDNTPVFLKHSLSMSTRVCPTCGREL